MSKPKKTDKPARVREVAAPMHAEAPTFSSEAEERDFWQAQDSFEYVDWSNAKPVRLPNLKPSTATISLRLPEGMLEELKVLANQRDVPYQSLLKVFLADRLAVERDRKKRQLLRNS
jgi:predicted DNA binding CopG/RHH family protein